MASTEALMPPTSLQNHHAHHSGGASHQTMNSGTNSQNSQKSSSQPLNHYGSNNGGGARGGNHAKPRRVVFYKNGDRYFGGKLVTVPVNRHYSIRDLMSDLNKSVDLPYGVRRVYTPVSGREINSIDELVDGSSYVCASFEPFRSLRYGDVNTSNSNNANLSSKIILLFTFLFSFKFYY